MVQQESRVKKTLLNARVNLIFYFLTLALSFFSRKIFLDCLGANFVGLTGTLQNLLGFLNLAELGIGSAIGYLLYKPLFEHDQQKINEIISVMGYLYRWIGIIILAAGIILSFFLPLIFPDSDTGFSLPLIYFAYFSFLGSSLIGYFINYRQNLLGADQRNYVVTAYFQSATIIKTLVQMVLAYYTANYYLWVVVEFAFGIIYSFILNWKINQTYPWLKAEVAQGRVLLKKYPLIIKNTKKIFLHKIGIVIQWQAMPILIYAFVSLRMVAYYENYTLLVTKLVGLMNSVLGSADAAVGNLIAEGNYSKIEKVLWEMMTLRYWILSLVIVALFFLLPPFISLWLGNEYLLSNVVLILIIANIGIQITQGCLGSFIYGFGLFNDVWATLLQSGVFIVSAIILGPLFGLVGIILSSVVSLFLSYCIWKPYYLYHYGLKQSIWKYIAKWMKLICETGSIVLLISIIEPFFRIWSPYKSCFSFIVYALLLGWSSFVISFVVMLLFNPHAKVVITRFKR
jgi:hypothetical protein